MNRDERRRRARDAIRSYRQNGLPPDFAFPALFAHTASLTRILSRKKDQSRASAVARACHDGFERSLQTWPPEQAVAPQGRLFALPP